MKRIYLNGYHICYLEDTLYSTFSETVSCKVNEWISAKIYEEYKILPESPENIEKIKIKCSNCFYSNLGEWIAEQMRNELKFHRTEEDGSRYFCYRVGEFGDILYLVKDVYNTSFTDENIVTWSVNKNNSSLILFHSRYQALTFIQNNFSEKLNIKIKKQTQL